MIAASDYRATDNSNVAVNDRDVAIDVDVSIYTDGSIYGDASIGAGSDVVLCGREVERGHREQCRNSHGNRSHYTSRIFDRWWQLLRGH
jgi:hypothetical protein